MSHNPSQTVFSSYTLDFNNSLLLEFHVPFIKLPLKLLKIWIIFDDCVELLPLSVNLLRLLFRNLKKLLYIIKFFWRFFFLLFPFLFLLLNFILYYLTADRREGTTDYLTFSFSWITWFSPFFIIPCSSSSSSTSDVRFSGTYPYDIRTAPPANGIFGISCS